MSGSSPLRRPETARPRGGTAGGAAAGGAPAEAAPPSAEELAVIERQLALLPTFSGATAEEVPALGALVVRSPGRGPGYNYAACLRWPAGELVEGLLNSLAAYFVDAAEWPSAVLADGLSEPADLAARLAAAGWVELERERVMVSRAQPSVPHLSPALRLEAVTGRTAGECQALEQRVFGLHERYAALRAEHLAQAVDSGGLRGFMIRLDGVAVASARLSAADGVAVISGVGVAPAQRGHGFGTLVTAVATRAGLAMGNSLVCLSVDERNERAMRLYNRLGYRPSFAWSRWAASAR